MKITYSIVKQDQEYVATCDNFPDISYSSKDKDDAFNGIQQLTKDNRDKLIQDDYVNSIKKKIIKLEQQQLEISKELARLRKQLQEEE